MRSLRQIIALHRYCGAGGCNGAIIVAAGPRVDTWRHKFIGDAGGYRSDDLRSRLDHTIRPPKEYIEQLKREQIREYGYQDHRLRDYEEDHLIPLNLGGAPMDPRNLWPQPRRPADGWTAEMKHNLEAAFVRQFCSRQVPLDVARRAIAQNWHETYRRFVHGG
jgi:hypothetical protein